MDDLIEFLRARLDEDEAVARAVEDRSAPWDGQWVADGADCLRTYNGHVLAYGHRTTDGRDLPIPLKAGLVEHWARHGPARVLADVESKRRIIGRYEEAMTEAAQKDRLAAGTWRPVVSILEPVMKDLAQAYSSHPDYRPEWAPAVGST